MTPAERETLADKLADHFLLMAEELLERASEVVFGKKRIAVVPRKHPKVKEGPIYELRLVKVPDDVKVAEPSDKGLLTDEELEKI